MKCCHLRDQLAHRADDRIADSDDVRAIYIVQPVQSKREKFNILTNQQY